MQALYFDDFELFRKKNSSGVIEKQTETLHITDNAGRMAMVETPVITNDGEQQLIRFVYSDRNGSSQLELNGQGVKISYNLEAMGKVDWEIGLQEGN